MIRNILLLAFLSVLPLDMSAQLWVGYKSDSVRIAEYRQHIGLDYSMPDVTTVNELFSHMSHYAQAREQLE